MTQLKDAELILNRDGSIYHLNLLPEDLAETVIFVGDPDRVPCVSKHFDSIELKKSKREFVTHTGYIGKKRVSVISTGIGTDNIDIVLNECDALMNIDFKTRRINENIKPLKIIRMGTSGGIHESIGIDSLLISKYAIGLDDVLSFYEYEMLPEEAGLQDKCRAAFCSELAYASKGSENLYDKLSVLGSSGITLTCSGFYGPQQRQTRIPLRNRVFEEAACITHENLVVTNAEMETAAIYGLSRVFGHEACSVSAIVANRVTGEFSKDVEAQVEKMITDVLAGVFK